MAKKNGIKVTIEGDELVLRAPIPAKLTPSVSGKTLIVASSYGNQETGVKVEGRNVVIGFNAYIYPERD